MEFNNTTDKNGLIQQCEINLFGDSGFGQISGNPNRLQIFTNFINDAYSRYAILALMSDSSWQFDDNNYTDFPIATTDLIANQPDYTLNNTEVIIDQVEILDPTGTIWMPCPELDQRLFEEYKVAQSQYNNNVAATPIQHVKMGNSIYLYPTPIYSITQADNGTGGVRVRFKRPPSYFAVTDTTKKPGFSRMLHDYLSDYPSWKYASVRSMPIAKTFADLVAKKESSDIPNFYRTRSSESPTMLRPIWRNSR